MPLTALTRKNKQTGQPITFEWSDKCEESFQKIKNMLISAPLLVPPDLCKEFSLWVDACEDGFGVILEQIGADDLTYHRLATISYVCLYILLQKQLNAVKSMQCVAHCNYDGR